MNDALLAADTRQTKLSAAARERMLGLRGEPFLFSHWRRAVFIHFEVDAKVLQREVPFELDLREDKAYVSLVAFYLEKMRMRRGGKLTEWLMKPIATHEFLNIRTYVRHRGEAGIYFLAEYLPNPLSLLAGPRLYGLPYRLGKLHYQHEPESGGVISGRVSDGRNVLSYRAEIKSALHLRQVESETLDEFLLERYSAFTHRNGGNRVFRVWHPPWSQTEIDVQLKETSLLAASGHWFKHAQLIGGNYSPGFDDVWMGIARKV